MEKLKQIVSNFEIEEPVKDIRPLGNGLINTTYIVETEGTGRDYVLQKVNTGIFKDAELLQKNIEAVCSHIRKKLDECGEKDINRKVLEFVKLKDGSGKTYFIDSEDGGCWRVSVMIPNSSTPTEVSAESARETGRAFANFQQMLVDVPQKLGETIPDFHNMELRLNQLKDAIAKNVAGRYDGVKDIADYLLAAGERMTLLEKLAAKGKIGKRICHCDTKVSNMLVDSETGEFLCVIDLDTTMPSFVTSDFGDFLRSGAATVAEGSPETDKIDFRTDIYEAFKEGYLSVAREFLSETEISVLPFSAALFPYMQAVRFFTDYLNGDTYYHIDYPEQNLVRARNQIKLWEKVEEKLGVAKLTDSGTVIYE